MSVKNKKPAPTEIQKRKTISVSKKFSDSVVARKTLTVDVYNTTGKVVGKVSLPKTLFAAKVNPALMAQAVRVYLANRRAGTASTKTRGEVRGSTRKIYRQKHTGRARHGAKRAPLFVGGGIVFGPKPRDFSLKFPEKMKKKALMSALTSQFKDKRVKVITGFDKITPKTKAVSQTLTRLVETDKNKKILIVVPGPIDNLYRAAQNIRQVSIRPVQQLATYEVLNSNTVLFMKEGIEKLGEIYAAN